MTPDRNRGALAAFAAALASLCASSCAPGERLLPATAVEHEIVARYSFDNRAWGVVLVAPGISHEAIVDLARQLVASHPENSFRIFDDDSQLDSYLEWRLNPNTEEVAKPEVWIGRHHLATIRGIRTERGQELQLRGGPAHPTHAGRKILGLGS